MITVNFHKSIRKYTNNQKSFTSDAVTYLDLIQNCMGIFPDLLNVFKSYIKYNNNREGIVLISNNKIIDDDSIGFKAKGNIYLCPVIYGGGGKGFAIIAVIIIIAIIIFSGGTATPALAGAAPAGTVTTGAAVGIGGGLTVSESVLALQAAEGVGLGATGSGAFSLSLGQRFALNIAFSLIQNFLAPSASTIATVAPDAGIRRNNDVFEGLINTTGMGTPVFLNYGLTRVPGQLLSGYIKTVGHGKTDIIEVGKFFNGSN